MLRFLQPLVLVTLAPLSAGITSSDPAQIPWVQLTENSQRTIAENGADGFWAYLQSEIPAFEQLVNADLRFRNQWMPLWAQSINFDEGAHGITVDPAILDALLSKLGGPTRNDRIVHAGIEHTYGYLFSNLKTSFGYKRARWIDGQMEIGLKLPSHVLDLETPRWGFLTQLTFLLGSFALQDHPAFQNELRQNPSWICPEFWNWRMAQSFRWKRLVEDLRLPGRTVSIRTDFLPFTGGGALLIYSVIDTATDAAPRLITAFPVTEDFMRRALDERKLGAGQEIETRYNASVPDITGRKWKGQRRVDWMRAE